MLRTLRMRQQPSLQMRLRCCPTTGQTSEAWDLPATTRDAPLRQLTIERLSPAERTLTSWSTYVVQDGRWATGVPMADCTTSYVSSRTGAVRPSITRDQWPASTTPLTLREPTKTAVTPLTIPRLETTFSIISSPSHKTCRRERRCSAISTT